jgi:hypothetical protein
MTFNSEQFVNNILELFFEVLTEEGKSYTYSQHASAAKHSVEHLIRVIQTV